MSMKTTIKTTYRNFTFAGTASIAEFWTFAVIAIAANLGASLFALAMGSMFASSTVASVTAALVQLVTFVMTVLPLVAASARRLRDAGFSSRWVWVLLAPVLAFAGVLAMLAAASTTKKGANGGGVPANLVVPVFVLIGAGILAFLLFVVALVLPTRTAEQGNKYATSPLERPMSYFAWLRSQGWRHLVGILVSIYSLFPILYILSVSLSDGGGVDSGVLFSQFNLGNYIALFTDDNPDRPFVKWIVNTVTIASVTAIGSVFLSALAAYSFSRMRFRGRRSGLLSLLLLQMFPSILGLVAIYSILSEFTKYVPALGLNTPWGLILVYLGGSLGGGTYLMYGFFNTVPTELDEAAKIDGATHTQIYFRIILRLVAPILAVMALLSFIGTSSDFILASIVLNKPDQYTLAVGLGLFIDQPYSKNWAMFCAGAVISATPIVVLFMSLQRYIVSGLTGGAVKG